MKAKRIAIYVARNNFYIYNNRDFDLITAERLVNIWVTRDIYLLKHARVILLNVLYSIRPFIYDVTPCMLIDDNLLRQKRDAFIAGATVGAYRNRNYMYIHIS